MNVYEATSIALDTWQALSKCQFPSCLNVPSVFKPHLN